MSAYAREEGIGQAKLWRWARDAGSQPAASGEKVGFVRIGSLARVFGTGAREERGDEGELQSDITLEGAELRAVARRGARWSDVRKLAELIRSGR